MKWDGGIIQMEILIGRIQAWVPMKWELGITRMDKYNGNIMVC